MYTGKIIFSQVMDHLPMHIFHRNVQRYNGNHKIKDFTCLDQYLCMAFAQLTYRESLRDIEACLRAQNNKLYHMGIRSNVSRNTLSNANKIRDWRIIYFAVATGTVAYERYRVPIMPYIIILSCYGIIQLQRRFREYRTRRKTNKISSQ